jgi:hypothetical protein
MNLADRGGASGYIGDAWSEACTRFLVAKIGSPIAWGDDWVGTIASIIDVDAIPGIASFASARALQNPDYLLAVQTEDATVLVAADAKFSVETAKPRQVSAEIVSALVGSEGSPLTGIVPHFDAQVDGFFLSPNYPLTDLVLQGTAGILRAAVGRSDVVTIEPEPKRMFDRADLAEAMALLADLDDPSSDWQTDLIPSLYYARCAFAALGSRLDELKPLLGPMTQTAPDPGFVRALRRRCASAASAWRLVLAWDRDAEIIRATRMRVHAAAELGLMNRDLRNQIEQVAREAKIAPPPSINRVRRALALWTQDALVSEFGELHYPITDLETLLLEISAAVDRLRPAIPARVEQIVRGSIPV